MDVDRSVPLLLDGATATNLFPEGVPPDLCLEQWILDHPQKLVNLQKSFLELGCDILYAPTFGANAARLKKFGLQEHVEEYNLRLVELTKTAAEGKAAVAGVLSPTGLELEPFGETSFPDLIHIYREQAAAMKDAGADLFVVETMVSISEARAAALALKRFHLPVVMMMTVDENGDTLHGGNAVNALVMLQELGISAFGLNCACGAESMVEVISQMKEFAKIPLAAKPAACRFDEETEKLIPVSPAELAHQMELMLDAGATIIGGCCGTTVAHLRAVRDMMREYIFGVSAITEERENKGDIVLADCKQVYNLYNDYLVCSEPLACSPDMTDDLLELEEQSVDVILLQIHTLDDGEDFARNAHIANLPVCFYSEDEEALRHALLLYNGRAMIDSRTQIETNVLKKIAKKYGAVIY